MKTKKLAVVLAAAVLAATALCSCANPFAFIGIPTSTDSSDAVSRTEDSGNAAAKYTDDAVQWVTAVLSDYAHREYNAGENVDDMNILYLGFRYCQANAKKLDGVITSGNDEKSPETISITGTQMEKVCKNLISSDFSLSNYHPTMGADKYYSVDDLYVFGCGRDYWMGDNYSTTDAKAYVAEDGKISVEACTYHYPSIGLAKNFRMLEYIVEPIEEDGCVYFKLNRITDKGSAEGFEREAVVRFTGYQNLNDLTYPYDGVEWDKRPLLATAKLTVPMTWSVSGDEILSVKEFEDSTGYVRCMQFELIKVDKDYVLTHDIHDLRTTEEMRKHKDSDEVAVMWRFYDDFERSSGRSAAGYDYISYYKEYTDDDGKKNVQEQRYYRVSDEYVLGVYYGADDGDGELGRVQSALNGMTFEVK